MKNLTAILKVLSDPNRIRILKLLKKRKMCVCELSSILGITQPSVSRHLKKLKAVQLIAEEQDSFWTNYYLAESDNLYAMKLLRDIDGWLNNDTTVAHDRKKLKLVNREKLCCR